jgi:hypothetical protein
MAMFAPRPAVEKIAQEVANGHVLVCVVGLGSSPLLTISNIIIFNNSFSF